MSLSDGKIGESHIACWLKVVRGRNVLPVYEKQISDGKGPQVFMADGSQLTAPDILVFGGAKQAVWIEAKHKSAFSWHRKTGRWTTGIDLHHYEHYLKIAESYPEWPVWLMFLHRPGCAAKDTPGGMESPHGLYGEDIQVLRALENHRSHNHGKTGMVYWAKDSLRKLAEYDEVLTAVAEMQNRIDGLRSTEMA